MPIDLSRREFLGRLGSRDTLRKLLGLAVNNLDELIGGGENSRLSVEDAGRALRNVRCSPSRELPEKLRSALGDGAGTGSSGDAAPAAGDSRPDEVNGPTRGRGGTEDAAALDSDEPQAPA